MTDSYGRKIDYMRVSVTDQCNLRCKYCTSNNTEKADGTLRFSQILRLCRIAVSLGIVKFKITGGEPLVRKGCVDFIEKLKELPGVQQVTLTTNGILLNNYLDQLRLIGIDGINISLDTTDEREYRELTGGASGVVNILKVIKQCTERGIRTKINTVLVKGAYLYDIAELALKLPVDVRFIEKMPIGERFQEEKSMPLITSGGISTYKALERLRKQWQDLQPVSDVRGNGPAEYFGSRGLKGRIGFIGALSNNFCAKCNRVRLTSTGMLKPCLGYDERVDLATPLRSGCSDEELQKIMYETIYSKPLSHRLSNLSNAMEQEVMQEIGG